MTTSRPRTSSGKSRAYACRIALIAWLMGRKIACCFSSFLRNRRESTGVSVSAMNSEISTEPAIVSANWR